MAHFKQGDRIEMIRGFSRKESEKNDYSVKAI
jgi:hypothetical protein